MRAPIIGAALCAVLLLAFARPAWAPPEPCWTLPDWKAGLAANSPDAVFVAELAGEDARIFIAAFAAMGGGAAAAGDTVAGWRSTRPDRAGKVMILIGLEGCVFAAGALPERYWLAPLAAVERARERRGGARRDGRGGFLPTGGALCGPYPIIAATLRARFGERPLYRWPTPAGTHVVEFWWSEGGRTVSIVARDAGGTACVIATGRFAERVGEMPAEEGAGA